MNIKNERPIRNYVALIQRKGEHMKDGIFVTVACPDCCNKKKMLLAQGHFNGVIVDSIYPRFFPFTCDNCDCELSLELVVV